MKISVIAHPNAKRPRVEKDLLGTIHVYVNQPPLEGKANAAVIEAIAEYFHVKKNTILLISGDKSKQKLFEITGIV
jgi:uncharacterized protein YggU (UPF0235/DUF167 family)